MIKPTTRSNNTSKDRMPDDGRERIERMEQELMAIREESKVRMAKIRAESESRQAMADQRHAELLALLLKLNQPSPTPTTTVPPPPSTQPIAPVIGHIGTSPKITSLIPPKAIQGSWFQQTGMLSQPPLIHTPMYTQTQPPYTISLMIYDEQRLPIPKTFTPGSVSNQSRYKTYTGNGWGYEEPTELRHNQTRTDLDHLMQPPIASYGQGSGWVPSTDYRLRKLKMPIFEGEDAYGWVYKVERFFDMQGLSTSSEKLRAAVL